MVEQDKVLFLRIFLAVTNWQYIQLLQRPPLPGGGGLPREPNKSISFQRFRGFVGTQLIT